MMNIMENIFGIIGLILVAISFISKKNLLIYNWCGSVLLTVHALLIGDVVFIALEAIIVLILTYRNIEEMKKNSNP